ncbi:hypothetical protein MYSEV_149 [Mythimna separata entomopoxvirus 'L']|uniref:Uncharacterized protein n=1 Tax=Mythimna separata entomopoxvirus 'L' TaxID=1293572 RepID=A0A916KQ93_9POXV|nr:hypothetical protein MYSEV_149 [Mythimna separata entomopoxvirus 'L']CCU56347.1 hypothetical protein MYSEV_149 [Mythimna separata entomopoxvirus 'L']
MDLDNNIFNAYLIRLYDKVNYDKTYFNEYENIKDFISYFKKYYKYLKNNTKKDEYYKSIDYILEFISNTGNSLDTTENVQIIYNWCIKNVRVYNYNIYE